MAFNQSVLRDLLEKALADFDAPAFSASVWYGGQEYHCGAGLSNIEAGIPASSDTVYGIASSSKAINGYRSGQLFLPEKDIAISILSNGPATDGKDALLYTILDLLLDLPDGGWTKRYRQFMQKLISGFEQRKAAWQALDEKAAPRPCSPEEYCGKYHDPGYGDLTFTCKNGRLSVLVCKAEYPLLHLGEDRYLLVFERWLEGFEICFLRDDAGRITGLDMYAEAMLPDDPVRFNLAG